MSEDSNRNATASWSGFSHQGQVGLLLALRELQKDTCDKNNTYVQFEKHEDVAIFIDKLPQPEFLSVHQVKAYYSANSDKTSKYKSVLNDDFEPGNERFLHTTLQITDWDTSITTNKNNVKRYEYSKDIYHCGTTEIETFIKDELKKIIGDNDWKINSAIKKMTYFLDFKIRSEHQKKNKGLFDVKFSLSEIENIVLDESEFKANDIYVCRNLFFDIFMDFKINSNLEEKNIDQIEELICEIYESFNDDEFLLFVRRLSLNRKPANQTNTHSIFSEDGLRQVFYEVLFEVSTIYPEVNKVDLTVFYKSFGYVLTTIIDDKKYDKEVVKNILNNMQSQSIHWERTSLINREINGKFHELNPDFFDVLKQEKKEKDFTMFMYFNGSTEFVCRETAKNNLTNGKNS